jgi:outer membrane protein assembly factor BamB
VAAVWAVNAMACVPTVRYGPDSDTPGWPVYLGAARHDASARESLPTEPQPLWRTGAGRSVRGAIAIGTTVVAVGTTDRAVVLLERATGKVLWRRRVSGTIAGGPLIAGTRVFAATQAVPDGRVLALELRTGKTLWSVKTAGVTAPLALADTLVIAATDAGDVLGLAAASGQQRWRRPLGRVARATPVPTADGVVVATLGDSLFLLDAATGTVHARLPTPGTVVGTPATDGRRLFFGTTAGHLVAVALPALTVLWDRSVDGAVYGAAALQGDTLLALTDDGTLWLVPVDSPATARHVALGIPATAGPTPIAGGVLVAGVTGEVVLVDAASDSVRWRLQRRAPIEEPPLVRDQQLFLVSGGGSVEVLK